MFGDRKLTFWQKIRNTLRERLYYFFGEITLIVMSILIAVLAFWYVSNKQIEKNEKACFAQCESICKKICEEKK